MKSKRTLMKAAEMTADFVCQKVFKAKYIHQISDDFKGNTKEGKELLPKFFDRKFVNKLHNLNIKQETIKKFKNSLIDVLIERHKTACQKNNGIDRTIEATTIYIDYHPNELIKNVCDKSNIPITLLPSKLHCYIDNDLKVWVRLGHHIGDVKLI